MTYKWMNLVLHVLQVIGLQAFNLLKLSFSGI
jgi:hypothetical protein